MVYLSKVLWLKCLLVKLLWKKSVEWLPLFATSLNAYIQEVASGNSISFPLKKKMEVERLETGDTFKVQKGFLFISNQLWSLSNSPCPGSVH